MRALRAVGPFALLTACGAPSAPPATAARMIAHPAASGVDGRFDAGRLALHVHCTGSGSPAVVLEAGLGNDGSVWNDVLPEIARFTRACAYDRAGMGQSSGPAPRPHTNRKMAGELYAVLASAQVAGPYVLVGHSMGATNVRLFASDHPNDVAGVVLVDAMTDEQPSRYWSLLPEAAVTGFKQGLRELPEGVDFDTLVGGLADAHASNRGFGDKPLVVLTRGKEDPPFPGAPAELVVRLAKVWQELQAELPKLSTNSAHVVAAESRHFIQWDAPKLVVAAVREVVEASRAHRRVDATHVDAR